MGNISLSNKAFLLWVKFACKTTCGNAPKKRFLLEFNKAFAEVVIDFMINSVSDNFEWSW
ncbi:hypothetical protein Q2T40_00995 [Winogradskyella maritima]|nr:hypothetical protein [Winogradskyella maritima]